MSAPSKINSFILSSFDLVDENLIDFMVLTFLSFAIFIHSATSVDVEEHLYRLATNSGITVITSSQVCRAANWLIILLLFLNCIYLVPSCNSLSYKFTRFIS